MQKYTNKITRFQYMNIIQGSMIGVGILSLPSSVCDIAKQSGWISTLLCGVYPLYIALGSCFVYKNMNYIDFAKLNKKLYGKILYYFFMFAFFVYFLFYSAFVISGFANVLTFSTTKFLSPYTIIIISAVLVYLSTNEGLTNIGRISEFLFPLTLFIGLIPIYFIGKGDLTNVLPVISDFKSILKAMPDALFSYSGVEISILIVPFITKTKKLKLFSALGSLLTIFMYTIIVFITILYCGYRLTAKLQYPFLYLVAGAELPVISSFEPLFIFLWGNKIFQTISIGSFGASYSISQLFKISYNKCSIFCCAAIAIISFFLIPEQNRTKIINTILPYMIIFIIVWLALSLILSFIRRGEAK